MSWRSVFKKVAICIRTVRVREVRPCPDRHQVHARIHPEKTLRRSMGILRLAKDFDAQRLEAACERALTPGSTSYRSLRALIQAPQQQEIPGLSIPAHDNLRGPSYYQ